MKSFIRNNILTILLGLAVFPSILFAQPDIEIVWDEEYGYPDMIDLNRVFPGELFAGGNYSASFIINNRGNDNLEIRDVSFSNPGLFQFGRQLPRNIAEGRSEDQSFGFHASDVGIVECTMTITTNDFDEREIEISIRAEATSPPIMWVSRGQITLEPESDSAQQNFTIQNEGDEAVLEWWSQIDEGQVAGRDDANQTTITLEPSEGSLQPGEEVEVSTTFQLSVYEGQVDRYVIGILSNDPNNAWWTIDVTITWPDEPNIEISWSETSGFPNVINFNSAFLEVYVGESYSIPLTFRNTGTSDLIISRVTPGSPLLSLSRNPPITIRHGGSTVEVLTFSPIETGIMNVRMVIASNDPDRGIIQIPIAGTAVPRNSVSLDQNASINNFILSPAFPNPFNGTTTIRYQTSGDAYPTRLAIYDPAGRLVEELIPNVGIGIPTYAEGLVNGPYAGGMHSVTWNATGRASGNYIVRLQAGGQVLQQPVVLVK